MADNAKFPGTEMKVFEKYSDSRRLDHPDFGDVAKTSWAKGVISDFKVDDPDNLLGTIHSQVKVTGDWGESEFIPLFYHPKKQFWDGGDAEIVKATDFNKDDQYFERAWMSYRKDDEVVVMLKEGTPVAVLGFADGVLRVGENWVKTEHPPFDLSDPFSEAGLVYFGLYALPEFTALCQGIATGKFAVDATEKGPDGFSLGLKKLAEFADGGGPSVPGRNVYMYRGISSDPGGGAINPGALVECQYNNPPWGGGRSDCQAVIDFLEGMGGGFPETVRDPLTTGSYYYSPGGTTTFKARVYVYVIGPILFATYLLLQETVSPGGGGWYSVNWAGFSQAAQDWSFEPRTEPYVYNPPPVSGVFDATLNGGPSFPASGAGKWGVAGSANKAALYSKKLYEEVLSALPNIVVGGGNAWFGGGFPAELQDFPGVAALISSDSPGIWLDGVKLTVRPHTKEELQAADMWPAGVS